MSNTDRILDRFISNVWLFKNIFGWELTKKIVYNTEKEKVKNILFEIYWKKDVFKLFTEEVDERKVDNTLKTLFQYYESRERETDK